MFFTLGCDPFWYAVCSHQQRLNIIFLKISYNHYLLAESARMVYWLVLVKHQSPFLESNAVSRLFGVHEISEPNKARRAH